MIDGRSWLPVRHWGPPRSPIRRQAARPSRTPAEPAGRTTSRTYVLAAPIERVWQVYTDARERPSWFGTPGSPLDTALETRPPTFLRSALDHPGMPGPCENVVTFETIPGGTRMTHGFIKHGDTPEWENLIQSSADGIDEMVSDLALYPRTGVPFPRHTGRAFKRAPHANNFRQGTRNTPGGVEVFDIPLGSLPAELGMQPGDTIVAIDDAGIYCIARNPPAQPHAFARRPRRSNLGPRQSAHEGQGPDDRPGNQMANGYVPGRKPTDE